MFRLPLAAVLAGGLVASAGLTGVPAQEKKTQPKLERIAVADPKQAAEYPGFGVQGEYVGEATTAGAKQKVGAQVIARGAGAFDVRVLKGGLPGDGWDGKTEWKGTATRGEDGVAPVTGKDFDGMILDKKLNLKIGDKTDAALSRVERKSPTLGAKPPEGAKVLFAKEGDEANWLNGKLMELSDGKFLTVAKTGNIRSQAKLGAFKAHIEFRTPYMPNSTGQARGNSGVYIQDRYECQVLDSFGLSGENNECGGFYTLHKPLVNMCLPPLVWQTYDIEFTPAVFDADGKKTKNARATVLHNGVKIQDNVELPKESPGGQKEAATPGPLHFQDHGDPVVFRNVWVVEVK